MSYPFNYPTPQNANIQIFSPNTLSGANKRSATWVKPQGASMVWFTLIGPGGSGGSATSSDTLTANGGGGGSGAVTNCMIPAFLIPDTLNIMVYPGGVNASGVATEIFYQQKTGTGYSLLVANGGTKGANGTAGTPGAGGAGGAASTSNYFSAAGFFQSVAGQAGSAGSADQTTSNTTFLQGGVGGHTTTTTTQAPSQYGYTKASLTAPNVSGYGMLSPIIVSVASNRGRSSVAGNTDVKSGFGSGGGGAYASSPTSTYYGIPGGDGMVVIITW